MDEQTSSRQEFEPDRNVWLRKHHRPVLGERFKVVFGNEGMALYQQFEAAYRVCQGNVEAFQQAARTCLRGAARIPLNGSGRRRRIQYMKACIAEANGWWQDNGPRTEGEESPLSLSDIVKEIAKKSHVSDEAIFQRIGQLLSIYAARKNVKEGCLYHLVANAKLARNPLRYLAAAIRNERRRTF